jgi:hypothetical protein
MNSFSCELSTANYRFIILANGVIRIFQDQTATHLPTSNVPMDDISHKNMAGMVGIRIHGFI